VVVADSSAQRRSILARILRHVGIEVHEVATVSEFEAQEFPGAGVFWGLDESSPPGSIRICPRDGHEKDASQSNLFAPFLPSDVLRHSCHLLRVPQRVGLLIPNAVLRTLVGGILRKVGHETVILEQQPSMNRPLDVVVVDVREGDDGLDDTIASLRNGHPSAEIVTLVGTFQSAPGLSGCHRVKRPVDAAALLWEVEGWGRESRALN
jgi:hypothetical protein